MPLLNISCIKYKVINFENCMKKSNTLSTLTLGTIFADNENQITTTVSSDLKVNKH